MGNSDSCSTSEPLPSEGDMIAYAPSAAPSSLAFDVDDLSTRMDDALERAARESKRVLLLIGVDWCTWSTRLSAVIDGNVIVREIIDESYVVLNVNYDTDRDGCEDYAPDMQHTPWLTVVDDEGAVVAQQGTSQLEKGEGHDPDKLYLFLFLNRAAVAINALPPTLVISGPESATVVRAVVAENPEVFERVMLYTARAPMAGERNGVDRYFTSAGGIAKASDAGEMLTWADASGVSQAVSVAAMGAVAEQSKVCVIDLGVQACPAALQSADSSTTSFFIAPSSKERFEAGLRAAGGLSEADIAVRLRLADDAMASLSADESRFDIVLINDDLVATCDRVRSVAFVALQQSVGRGDGVGDDDAAAAADVHAGADVGAAGVSPLRKAFLADSERVLLQQAAALEGELAEAHELAQQWKTNLVALAQRRVTLQATSRAEGERYVDTLVSLLGLTADAAQAQLAGVQAAVSVDDVPKAAQPYVAARIELGLLVTRIESATRELAGLEDDIAGIETERAADARQSTVRM